MKQIFDSRTKPILGVVLLVTVFIIQACGEKPQETTAKDKTVYTDTISVEAITVKPNELAISKTFSGSLEGEEQANIIAKIPETIVKIRVKVGDFVKAGSILFELDKGGASSQFYQAQAAFLNAQKNFERMQNLLKEGAVSQQAFDGVQTQYEVAKANFDAARSTVEITSPISGVVTAINVNLGDIASPQMPMATVANISRMKAVFNVGEGDVPNLFVGQTVSIYSEMNPDLVQTGRINQLSKSASIQSRTFEMQAIFSNTNDRWFKPGMFCRVSVDMKSRKDALTIPLSAVVKAGSEDAVYIISDGKSYLKKITLGLSDGKNSEVTSGLNSGDKVVTLGMNNLKDGTVVVVSNK
jgi:RND family efflux transporter MFP subunit